MTGEDGRFLSPGFGHAPEAFHAVEEDDTGRKLRYPRHLSGGFARFV
jgi:hypothetical protein